jgi:hypothetical protein
VTARRSSCRPWIPALIALACVAPPAHAKEANDAVRRIALDRTSDVQLVRCRAEVVDYRGRHAMRLLPLAGQETTDTTMIAIVAGSDFANGTIALDVAGSPRTDIAPGSRGFIGLAFHVTGEPERYECFYVRPTNARCDDQLRRNHTTQYVAMPDWTWQRLRGESPGVYESYADMEAGAWTHLEVHVDGTHARLYVNGATQPALVVNDLKLGDPHGAIALWSWTYTDGYFSGLTVRPQ